MPAVGKSILIIDDSDASRQDLAAKLRDNGFTVHEASGGCSGVQKAVSTKPDCMGYSIASLMEQGTDLLNPRSRCTHDSERAPLNNIGETQSYPVD